MAHTTTFLALRRYGLTACYLGWVVLGTGALTACAGTRLIDSEVRSFGTAGEPGMNTAADCTDANTAIYRFERLPSQRANDARQNGLEEAAAKELGAHCLALNPDLTERFSLQLELQTDTMAREREFLGNRRRSTLGIGPSLLNSAGWMALPEPPLYRYQLKLLMRNAATKAVVFESNATHIGPWPDTPKILPAIIKAALHDYPLGSQTARPIAIEIRP